MLVEVKHRKFIGGQSLEYYSMLSMIDHGFSSIVKPTLLETSFIKPSESIVPYMNYSVHNPLSSSIDK